MPVFFWLMIANFQEVYKVDKWQMTYNMAVTREKSAKWPSSSIFICEFRYLISDCLAGPPKNSFQSCLFDQALRAVYTSTRGVYLNSSIYNSLSEWQMPWLLNLKNLHPVYLFVKSDTLYLTVWMALPRIHFVVVYSTKHLKLYPLLQEVFLNCTS